MKIIPSAFKNPVRDLYKSIRWSPHPTGILANTANGMYGVMTQTDSVLIPPIAKDLLSHGNMIMSIIAQTIIPARRRIRLPIIAHVATTISRICINKKTVFAKLRNGLFSISKALVSTEIMKSNGRRIMLLTVSKKSGRSRGGMAFINTKNKHASNPKSIASPQ